MRKLSRLGPIGKPWSEFPDDFLSRKAVATEFSEDLLMPSHATFTRALAVVALLTPLAAFAALGGTVTDIAADQARLGATRRVEMPNSFFEIHALTQSNGTVIREYVSPVTHQVFAVSWNGPARPDMTAVLGSYLQRTQKPVAHPDHRSLQINDGDLVVQSSGRMGVGFSGRAWLPQELPAGVQVTDIK